MWHPALDEVECPVTWDGVEALDDEDQRRLLDRVVLCPKTWKRVISKLHLAHSEYCDGQNSKARKLLVEAYAGILEPLGEINQCGASVVYRKAMKHVLDAMWTYVEMDELEVAEEDDDDEDSPRYQDLMKFAANISPVRKMDYQQRAALYAIRGALSTYPDNERWIQKAVHLNPCEAQWVIDLAYVVWDEDPEEPAPEPPKGLDAALAGRCVLLVEQAGSPSHNAKGCLLTPYGKLLEKRCGAGKLPPKWSMDLELMLLVARSFAPGAGKNSCRLGACKNKKKCTCTLDWAKEMLHDVMATAMLRKDTSPAILTQVSLTLLRWIGDMNAATAGAKGLLEAARREPRCQLLQLRLAHLLLPSLRDKKMAAHALEHAKRCESLYPFTVNFIRQGIEYCASMTPGSKPAQGVRKAGCRRRR